MRLFVIPLILVGLLVQGPTPALGNTNQQAAEKIADVIGAQFPDADVTVQYKGGQVWLKGEASSQSQQKQIVERVFNIPGINVTEISDEIQIVASGSPAQAARPAASLLNTRVPVPTVPQPRGVQQRMPSAAQSSVAAAVPSQAPQAQAQPQQRAALPPQTATEALLATAPQQHYPGAYGVRPGRPSVVPAPHTPQAAYVPYPPQAAQQQAMPQYAHQYQHQPAYYGPPAQAAYHPEAYGPQGPLPGQYNQPHLPDYAWPAYANYPNYAQVSYPRNYSPKAWPYIGPFYPYPQVPIGWRKVTLEHNNGSWWLDFDDGSNSGPFSGLFRQPARYTY